MCNCVYAWMYGKDGKLRRVGVKEYIAALETELESKGTDSSGLDQIKKSCVDQVYSNA